MNRNENPITQPEKAFQYFLGTEKFHYVPILGSSEPMKHITYYLGLVAYLKRNRGEVYPSICLLAHPYLTEETVYDLSNNFSLVDRSIIMKPADESTFKNYYAHLEKYAKNNHLVAVAVVSISPNPSIDLYSKDNLDPTLLVQDMVDKLNSHFPNRDFLTQH